MAFTISENQPSYSQESERATGKGDVSVEQVSSRLFLKTSAQSMDKNVVLRRLRHHKAVGKVKNSLRDLVAPADTASTEELYEKKWLAFTSP